MRDEDIERELGPVSGDFEVWPENWPTVQAFVVVQTQWSTGMSGPTGLDYSRVRAGLEMAGVDLTPDVFQGLRVMEGAALDVFSKRGEKK